MKLRNFIHKILTQRAFARHKRPYRDILHTVYRSTGQIKITMNALYVWDKSARSPLDKRLGTKFSTHTKSEIQ
jgi:hypothetical protein